MSNEDLRGEDDYEPSQEEWQEIEELILQEEMDEIKEARKDQQASLEEFKGWCKENGIQW